MAVHTSTVPCACCGTWTICADNTNRILDNSWDIYINNNFVGTYSGDVYENVCYPIQSNFLNFSSSNQIRFERTNCVSDDYFRFVIFNSNGTVGYSSSLSSGYCPYEDPPSGATVIQTFDL